MSNLKERIFKSRARIKKIYHELQNLDESINEINKDVKTIANYLNEIKIREFGIVGSYEEFWLQKFSSEVGKIDFAESYKRLIKGLDKESILTVNLMLGRIPRVLSNQISSIPIFLKEELEQIDYIKRVFWPSIVHLTEDCFCYNGYYLPVNHFEVSVFFYEHFINLLKDQERLRKSDIVDVGGFIGDSAIVFSKVTTGNVHTFEPINCNYQKMIETIEINNCNNVICIKAGLAEERKQEEFYFDGSASGYCVGQFGNNDIKERVQLYTLDEYVKENNLNVGLIKVDVEGAEQEFLKGAEQTIKKQKPALVISIYHSAYDFFQIKPLLESWDLGYNFRIIKPTDGQILLETILLAESIKQ